MTTKATPTVDELLAQNKALERENGELKRAAYDWEVAADRAESINSELRNTIRRYKYLGDTPGLSPDELNTELLQRQAQNKALRDALEKAVETIAALHGRTGWEIYARCSPEMKMIYAALKLAEQTNAPE